MTIATLEKVTVSTADGRLTVIHNGKVHEARITSVSFEPALYVQVPGGFRLYPLRSFTQKDQVAIHNCKLAQEKNELVRRTSFTE